MVEDPHTAVDDPELLVDVEVGDDAGDYPGDVKDVQHRDGDQAGREQGAEVPCLPVLDHNGEEEDVEEEGQEGDCSPGDPPPGGSGDNLQWVQFENIWGWCIINEQASVLH